MERPRGSTPSPTPLSTTVSRPASRGSSSSLVESEESFHAADPSRAAQAQADESIFADFIAGGAAPPVEGKGKERESSNSSSEHEDVQGAEESLAARTPVSAKASSTAPATLSVGTAATAAAAPPPLVVVGPPPPPVPAHPPPPVRHPNAQTWVIGGVGSCVAGSVTTVAAAIFLASHETSTAVGIFIFGVALLAFGVFAIVRGLTRWVAPPGPQAR